MYNLLCMKICPSQKRENRWNYPKPIVSLVEKNHHPHATVDKHAKIDNDDDVVVAVNANDEKWVLRARLVDWFNSSERVDPGVAQQEWLRIRNMYGSWNRAKCHEVLRIRLSVLQWCVLFGFGQEYMLRSHAARSEYVNLEDWIALFSFPAVECGTPSSTFDDELRAKYRNDYRIVTAMSPMERLEHEVAAQLYDDEEEEEEVDGEKSDAMNENEEIATGRKSQNGIPRSTPQRRRKQRRRHELVSNFTRLESNPSDLASDIVAALTLRLTERYEADRRNNALSEMDIVMETVVDGGGHQQKRVLSHDIATMAQNVTEYVMNLACEQEAYNRAKDTIALVCAREEPYIRERVNRAHLALLRESILGKLRNCIQVYERQLVPRLLQYSPVLEISCACAYAPMEVLVRSFPVAAQPIRPVLRILSEDNNHNTSKIRGGGSLGAPPWQTQFGGDSGQRFTKKRQTLSSILATRLSTARQMWFPPSYRHWLHQIETRAQFNGVDGDGISSLYGLLFERWAPKWIWDRAIRSVNNEKFAASPPGKGSDDDHEYAAKENGLGAHPISSSSSSSSNNREGGYAEAGPSDLLCLWDWITREPVRSNLPCDAGSLTFFGTWLSTLSQQDLHSLVGREGNTNESVYYGVMRCESSSERSERNGVHKHNLRDRHERWKWLCDNVYEGVTFESKNTTEVKTESVDYSESHDDDDEFGGEDGEYNDNDVDEKDRFNKRVSKHFRMFKSGLRKWKILYENCTFFRYLIEKRVWTIHDILCGLIESRMFYLHTIARVREYVLEQERGDGDGVGGGEDEGDAFAQQEFRTMEDALRVSWNQFLGLPTFGIRTNFVLRAESNLGFASTSNGVDDEYSHDLILSHASELWRTYIRNFPHVTSPELADLVKGESPMFRLSVIAKFWDIVVHMHEQANYLLLITKKREVHQEINAMFKWRRSDGGEANE